jgi:hypothetical protein
MGLASHLWNDQIPAPTLPHMAHAFGMRQQDVSRIFCRGAVDDKEWKLVTPAMVAARIDQYVMETEHEQQKEHKQPALA